MAKLSLSFFILLIFCRPLPAQEIPEDSGKVCDFQSRELALRLNKEVFPEMTAEQRSRLMALSTEICLSHIADLDKLAIHSVKEGGETEKEEGGWFSGLFETDGKGGKKGNERLKK